MKTMKKLTAMALAVLLVMGLAGCGSTDNSKGFADAKATLGTYTGIPVTVDNPEVTDEDVDQYINTLLTYYNMQAKADRTTIEDGDTVWVELHLFDEAGKELDDGTDKEGFVFIGSGGTYPELESGLIGKETGAEYEIPITLPDPYEFDETLSGQTITAKVTPQYIKNPEELSLETITDEQASLLDEEVHSVADLKAKSREILTEQTADSVRRQAYSGISTYLLENCKVDPFPGAELKIRVDKSLEQSKELCESYYNITFDEYLTQIGMTEDEYRADIESTLTDTLKLEVIFTAIGDKENIQYDQAAFDAYIADIVEQGGYENTDALYAEYGEDYVKRAYRIESIVDWLIDHADLSYTVTDKTDNSVSGNQPAEMKKAEPQAEEKTVSGSDEGLKKKDARPEQKTESKQVPDKKGDAES